jgi:hypothetical protein
LKNRLRRKEEVDEDLDAERRKAEKKTNKSVLMEKSAADLRIRRTGLTTKATYKKNIKSVNKFWLTEIKPKLH